LLLLLNLIAQAVPAADPLSGSSGWAGAGILGLVLGWLLLKHLPDKDKLITDLVKTKDERVQALNDANVKALKTVNEDHKAAVKEVVDHCEEQAKLNREAAKAEREASDRRHKEAMEMFQRIHESTRESIHATRNLGQTIRSRTFLADAVQSAEVPAWTKYLDGTLTSWNGACEKLFGWKQGEVVGKSIYESIIPPERRNEEEAVLKRIASGETVEEYETDRMDKRGRRVCVLVHTSPIRDQAGKVIGASTIARQPDH
jgi:PAS domain S-box-containing protein